MHYQYVRLYFLTMCQYNVVMNGFNDEITRDIGVQCTFVCTGNPIQIFFNLSTKHGFSPLYLALAFRLRETVKLLIEYGANTSIENGCGFKSASFDCNDKEDKTLQFLIQEDNVINNINDPDSYFSLFVFCQVEEIIQIVCNPYEF